MLSATPKVQLIAAALVVWVLLAAAPPAGEKKISVYSNVATYSLPVSDHNGREYVGLMEILDPLGRVSAQVSGARLILRFNNIDSEFVSGKMRARIRGRDVQLSAPLLVENSRGLVPLSALNTLLPRFLGTPVDFHDTARRLFIGEVATQVQMQLDSSNPAKLVMNFSAPVNPTISTEPGKLRMLFSRDPVLAPSGQNLTFDNKTITDAAYTESNGTAELTVSATAPMMASFSNNAKTITITVLPPASTGVSTPPSQPNQPATAEKAGTTVPQAEPPHAIQSPISAPHRMLAVVDASHGGDERGAALSDTLSEKDITLGFARLLRHELETRGFAVLLLRDADTTLTLDQRAGAANASRGNLFLSLHASSQGVGARVYTALLPVASEAKGPFQPWNVAQFSSLPSSQSVATAIVGSFEKLQFPARALQASLRPLNNVQMPAVAVELAPGPGGLSDLPSATYQQKAAAAIADAVASVRDHLGAQP